MTWAFRVVPLFLVATSGLAAAADSPGDRYNIDTACAADIQEAVAQNMLPANITADKASPVGVIFARGAIVSGRELGYSPDRVSNDIASFRKSMVMKMSSPDAVKAQGERTADISMVTKCAALYGFEVEQSVMGAK